VRRSIADVLRRGFDSTVANWPVIALRIAESLVFAGIAIAAILAAVVPALVAAGLSKDDIANSSDPASAVMLWVVDHLMLFVWFFALAFIVLGIMIAIHSFVEGASAQIYVDGERSAARRNAAARDDFRAFSVDRWLAGGAASWWRIFWLYNLAWSVGLAFVLVPLVMTMIGIIAVSGNTGRIVVACSGLALAALIFIPVAIITSIWCTKAITVCVARAIPARESLRVAWSAIRTDLGRHLAIAVLMFAISMALNSVTSAFSFPMTFTEHKLPAAALMFAPMRIAAGFVQGMVSAAVGSCLLACFVSITEER